MSSWSITKFQSEAIRAEALESGELPESFICDSYVEWVKTKEYAILERKLDGQIYPALQSKRGNSRYAKIHQKKLQNILCRFYDFSNNPDFSFVMPDNPRVGGSCVLFLTLNFSPHELSKAEAWTRIRSEVDENTGKIIGSSMHLFVANLHKIFRRYFHDLGVDRQYEDAHIVTQCTPESHESGYPHIHMTLILDRSLEVFSKPSKSDPEKAFWRIRDYSLVKKIKKAWARCAVGRFAKGEDPNSFCDVQAAVGDRIIDSDGNYTSALGYCLKYQIKTVNLNEMKDIKTHAYLKLYNTRSVIGKKYLERIGAYYGKGDTRHDELINDLQLRLAELKRMNEEIDELKRQLGGFFDCDDPDLLKLKWDYVALRLNVSYLISELEALRDWKYLGTVKFPPDSDLSGFFSDIKALNKVAERMSAE